MVPGDARKGGRGELDEGAGVCSPDQLDPLHVTVEGENVVQEIWLTHILKITGCRTSFFSKQDLDFYV